MYLSCLKNETSDKMNYVQMIMVCSTGQSPIKNTVQIYHT